MDELVEGQPLYTLYDCFPAEWTRNEGWNE